MLNVPESDEGKRGGSKIFQGFGQQIDFPRNWTGNFLVEQPVKSP